MIFVFFFVSKVFAAWVFFFFQAEDGIRDATVTGVQTCALPIYIVGSLFAAAGLVVLLAAGVRTGDPWRIASFAVYGAALVALYLFSTLYHSLDGRPKRIFRKLDHTSIYVLIAGTYTPFSLVPLRGPIGYGLLGAVWTLAAVGILQEFFLRP